MQHFSPFSESGKRGRRKFSWLLSKHWHDPSWSHRIFLLCFSERSAPQCHLVFRQQNEHSGFGSSSQIATVALWEVLSSDCFSKGCKFLFKILGTAVNGQNPPVRMAAILTILSFFVNQQYQQYHIKIIQDLCTHRIAPEKSRYPESGFTRGLNEKLQTCIPLMMIHFLVKRPVAGIYGTFFGVHFHKESFTRKLTDSCQIICQIPNIKVETLLGLRGWRAFFLNNFMLKYCGHSGHHDT